MRNSWYYIFVGQVTRVVERSQSVISAIVTIATKHDKIETRVNSDSLHNPLIDEN